VVIPETVPYAPLRGPLVRELGQDGVMVVTIDVPGEKVNTLGKAMMAEFDALLAELEAPGSVRAMVVRSGKPDNFIAGADIKDFVAIRSAMEGEALSRAGQALLDRLEAVPVPWWPPSRIVQWAAAWRSRWPAVTAWRRTIRRPCVGLPR
jgi:hypothetical protein